jgi:hypothetical protein
MERSGMSPTLRNDEFITGAAPCPPRIALHLAPDDVIVADGYAAFLCRADQIPPGTRVIAQGPSGAALLDQLHALDRRAARLIAHHRAAQRLAQP